MRYIKAMINGVSVRRLEYQIYHGVELSADEPQPLELALNDAHPPPLVYSTRTYRFAVRNDLLGAFVRRGVRWSPVCVSRVYNAAITESAELRLRSARDDSTVAEFFRRRSRPSKLYEGRYAELMVDNLRYDDAGVTAARVRYEWGQGRSECLEELMRENPVSHAFRSGTALALSESLLGEIAPSIDFQYFKVGRPVSGE